MFLTSLLETLKNCFSVCTEVCNTSQFSVIWEFSFWHCTQLLVQCSIYSSQRTCKSPSLITHSAQRQHLRITSTLYVALISPTLLNTRHVYFPLSSGFKLFKFNVHFFFLFSPISWGVRGLLSFSQVMSGLGFPLATHFRRTELPTGRAITLRLILAGCVNLGRAAKDTVLITLSKVHDGPHNQSTTWLSIGTAAIVSGTLYSKYARNAHASLLHTLVQCGSFIKISTTEVRRF